MALSDEDGIADFSILFLFDSGLFALDDLVATVLPFGASATVLDFAIRAFLAFEELTFGISTFDQT
jgi:hypothetical protein